MGEGSNCKKYSGTVKKSDVYETGVLGNRINSEKELRPTETMAESVQKRILISRKF